MTGKAAKAPLTNFTSHCTILKKNKLTNITTWTSRRQCNTSISYRKHPFPTPLTKLLWFLLNCNASLSVLVTGFYWTLLFADVRPVPDTATATEAAKIWLDRTLGHGLVPVLVLLDLLLVARRPFRFLHLWQPLLFGMTWAAFSFLYYQAGGRGYRAHAKTPDVWAAGGHHYIYGMVDWEKPRQTFEMVVRVGAALAGVHVLLCVVARVVACCRSLAWGEGLPGEDLEDSEEKDICRQIDLNNPRIVLRA